jgi:phosphoribosylformylglycinamidine cyclo-ligase
MEGKVTYADAGVDYDPIDEFKRFAQACARQTSGNIFGLDVREVTESRGESAYLLELPDRYIAFVDEGLGTKNLATQAYQDSVGPNHWRNVSFCTVAMGVNDLITSGARPLSASMHLQVPSGDWFADKARWTDLAKGWHYACNDAGCTWGPGETPALKGIIVPGTCSLSSATVGMIYPKSLLVRGDVEDGDRIILLGSSGIHANGLTLARKVADMLPDGYKTRLGNGMTYGHALLQSTLIYAKFVQECQLRGVRIKYLVNITGHGWRKLMRLDKPFSYELSRFPTLPAEFGLIQETANLSDKEMYETFNMGAGFALIIHPGDVSIIDSFVNRFPYPVFDAGIVKHAPEKQVVIHRRGKEPIVYGSDELSIR